MTQASGRSVTAAVAIGSNLGDRAGHLAFARQRLADLLHPLRMSSTYETAPIGVSGEQPLFLNAAAVGPTRLSARQLLDALLSIERDRGRVRPFPGAARTLDLDLILYGDATIDEPGGTTDRDASSIVVPHPRFRDRVFVLQPLADVAPDLVDPTSGLTVIELLTRAIGR